MWVKTLDNDDYFDARYFHIKHEFFGKPGEKYVLQGFSAADDVQSGWIIGLYPDKESAMAEMEKIFAAIEAGVRVYRFDR